MDFHAIKVAIKKRQKYLAECGKDSSLFKKWHHAVQRLIAVSRKAFCSAKIKSLKNLNVGQWWKAVKNISGLSANEGEWYSQLVNGSAVDFVHHLAEEISQYFYSLTASFVPLCHCDITSITVQNIPNNLLVTEGEAFRVLRLKKKKKKKTKKLQARMGCRMSFSKLLRSSLHQLSLISIMRRFVKDTFLLAWKVQLFIIYLKCIEDDIHPISLKCQVAKVLDRFTLERILPSILTELDPKQLICSFW